MCPKCFSQVLKIKQNVGWESLMVALTGKRRYHCRDCGNAFRAPDRRKTPREPEIAAAPQRSRAI